MNLLIKLLFVSFLVIATAVSFWPNIEQKRPPSPQVIEEDPLLKPIENYKSHSSSQKEIRQKPSSAVTNTTSSSIYRWVDENGQVHFSDQPSHEDAVAYTPKQLGSLDVSDDIKQRIAVDEYQLSKTKAAIIVDSSYSQASQASTKLEVDNFQFSNVSAGQKHGYVLMSGRISRGFRCKNLEVTAYASNDKGGFVRGHDVVSSRGSGSTLYEIKVGYRWNGKGRRPQWDAGSVSAVCLD